MSHSLLHAAQDATRKLGGTWHGSYGMAKCPAHDDRRPSLSIQPGHSQVLYHCFAGCTQEAIMSALKPAGVQREQSFSSSSPSTLSNPHGSNSRLRLALDIWDGAKNIRGTPAERYLQKRGIFGNGHARFDPRSKTIEIVDGERQMLELPAMVLPIHDNGGFVGIQRVFLTPQGDKASLDSPKKILGTIGGGSIRLGLKPKDTLNLAEGFEDAQGAIQANALSHCWAACGIERYKRIDIPEHIKRVVIYSQHGPEAARAIKGADDHLTANGRALEITLPPEGGDWNDILQQRL